MTITWRPPDVIELAGVGIVARRYRAEDADALHDAIEASSDHLRDFMFWADQSRDDTRQFVAESIGDWDAGRNFAVGLFDSATGLVSGGSGLHPRSTPDVVEIGYWRIVDAGGRGIVSAASQTLTAVAFTDPGVARVEIRCDVANRPSAAVPRRLGYELREIVAVEPKADGETGRHQVWSINRAAWNERTG